MDERLKEWDYAEDLCRKADEVLCEVVEDTIRKIIPFNEDDRFIFTEDGGMEEYDMPTIWRHGFPYDMSCKLKGFEIFNKRVKVLFSEGKKDEDSCRLIGIVPTSYGEIKWVIDAWLKKSGK